MPSFIPTISATVLAGFPEFIVASFGQKGLDYAYEVSGIPSGIAMMQKAYIPEVAATAFVEAAARLTGEHQLGLIFTPYISVENYGVLADYCFEAETLSEVFNRYISVLHFHASHNFMAIRQQGDSVKWVYQYATANAVNYDQLAFGTIGAQINFLRVFAGPCWLPDLIEMDIPKPRVTSLLEETYPCPIVFDAREFSITFGREMLDLRCYRQMRRRQVTLSDVRRSRTAPAPSGFLDVATNVIKSQMQMSAISLGGTAQLLGISSRSLQRGLDEFGHTFRSLTTLVRMDTAQELLRETTMTLTEIANELSYSSHSHFTRAFHAQADMTPSEFRQFRN